VISIKQRAGPVRRASPQLLQQRLCLLQIGRVKAFGEPAVDRGEEVAGFGAAVLVAAHPSEAHGGAQFPEFGLLLHGDAQAFAIQILGGFGMALSQQQLAFLPVQLSREPALACVFDDLEGIVEQSQGLFNSSRDLYCRGEEGNVGRTVSTPAEF